MTKKMTDFEATHGEFRAIKCEWGSGTDKICNKPVISGKAYCIEHYRKAYEMVNEEAAEEHFANIVESVDDK